MWMVLLLLSISGEDAPAAVAVPAARAANVTPLARCQNARVDPVDQDSNPAPALRRLGREPLANAYRPVVRHVECDRPVIVDSRVGQVQR